MTAESPMCTLGNNYGAVTDGRGATVALFHPSAAAHAALSTRGSRLKRRARTTPHESGHVSHDMRKTRAHDQATPRRLRTVMEYSFRGLFTLEGTLFRGLIDQGFDAWSIEGSTGAPDRQSQGLHGRAVQATLECRVCWRSLSIHCIPCLTLIMA